MGTLSGPLSHDSPAQRAKAFTYDKVALPSPSTHIRLLSLFPSANLLATKGKSTTGAEDEILSAPLHCSISTYPLDSAAQFNALSYTWGPPGDGSHVVKIMSTDGELLGNLSVTPSLDGALRHLRALAGGDTTTLWIDQICINQSDANEKTEQVKVMARIYRSARQVRVWLGPAADGSDELMDVWETIGRRVTEPDLNMTSFFTADGVSKLYAHLENLEPTNPTTMLFQKTLDWAAQLFRPHLHAMVAWYARPWFRRVWIVQEFALGENAVFICGYKALPPELVHVAITFYGLCVGRGRGLKILDLDPALFNVPLSSLVGIRKRRQEYQNPRTTPRPPGEEDGAKGHSLFELLRELYAERKTEASDVRDRIYALLGLAVDTGELGLNPDYSISDHSQVLLLAAKAIIRTGNLELLSFSQFPKERQLPSWVPDWRPGLAYPYHSTRNVLGESRLFSASGQSRLTLTETDDIVILGLAGCRVDIIEEVADPLIENDWDISRKPHRIRYLTVLTQVRQLCERSVAKGQPIYATPARRNEAVWRIPIADLQLTKQQGYIRATQASGVSYAFWLEEMLELAVGRGTGQPDAASSRDALLKRWGERRLGVDYGTSMHNVAGTRPFRTGEGYVGLAPVLARVGDVVVVFAGAAVPHVLRPRGGGQFEFIGDAYCDGVMDGEVWNGERLETFLLV